MLSRADVLDVDLAGVVFVPEGGEYLQFRKPALLIKAVGLVIAGIPAHLHRLDLDIEIALPHRVPAEGFPEGCADPAAVGSPAGRP